MQGARSSPPLRVTIAEDNPDLLRMFSLWFELEGFEVSRARNGLEALQSIAATRPHILVTDLAMPGVDGLELIRRVRELEDGAHLPILSITAQGSGINDLAIRSGACDCLAKPCMPEALVGHARALIEACDGRESIARCALRRTRGECALLS